MINIKIWEHLWEIYISMYTKGNQYWDHLLTTVPTRRPFGVKCVCMEPFPNMPCEKFLNALVARVSPFPAPTSNSPQPLSEVILRMEQLMPPLPLPLWDARFPAKRKSNLKYYFYTTAITQLHGMELEKSVECRNPIQSREIKHFNFKECITYTWFCSCRMTNNNKESKFYRDLKKVITYVKEKKVYPDWKKKDCKNWVSSSGVWRDINHCRIQ